MQPPGRDNSIATHSSVLNVANIGLMGGSQRAVFSGSPNVWCRPEENSQVQDEGFIIICCSFFIRLADDKSPDC
jgi:hypothetical protein